MRSYDLTGDGPAPAGALQLINLAQSACAATCALCGAPTPVPATWTTDDEPVCAPCVAAVEHDLDHGFGS